MSHNIMEKKKSDFRPDFFLIPSQVLYDARLRPSDWIVYAAVYWFDCMKDGKCIASNRTIASAANVSEHSVANSLSVLEKCGYIKRDYYGSGNRNREAIKALVSMKGDSPNRETDSSTGESSDSSNREQNNNIYNYIYKYADEIPSCIKAFEEIDERAKGWYGNKTQRRACDELLGKDSIRGDSAALRKVIASLKKTNQEQYAPKVHSFQELLNKWDKLRDHWASKAKGPESNIFRTY